MFLLAQEVKLMFCSRRLVDSSGDFFFVWKEGKRSIINLSKLGLELQDEINFSGF